MIFRNQILSRNGEAIRWRVLDLASTQEDVWVFCMDLKNALPTLVAREVLENTEIFSPVDYPDSSFKPEISVAAAIRRDLAYQAIKPLVESQGIYEPKTRSSLIQARALELGISPQTLYSYLRSWWRNGQTIHALTPKFDRSGVAPTNIGARGRPSKYGKTIYLLKPEDCDNFDKKLKFYLNTKLATLVTAYDKLIQDHYSYIDGENRLINLPPGERPSMTQFSYYAKKKLPKEVVIRKKKGDIEFELKHRPVLASIRASTHTVADVYEIDSTVADVLLTHSADRETLIGKPSLYLIFDRKSGLIVGFYVGLEGSSWIAAMQAILSICEDKKKLCERYCVPYDPTDWPAHCVMPKEFVGDRGPDVIGQASTSIAKHLGLTFTNLPKRRPDWKPIVECGIKQVHQPMRESLPGYTPPENFAKRQCKDPSGDAAFTLYAFTQFILRTIIKHNKTPITDYPMSPQSILSAIQPTPINIWNSEIRERAGLPTYFTEEQVRLALLPKTTVSVTREGIRLGECYYSAPEAIERGWFVAAGRNSFSVTASCDLRLVDTILIHDPDSSRGYFEAQLLEKCEHYRGLSHQEVEALGYARNLLRLQGDELARQLRTEFNHDTAPLIASEIAKTKQVSQGKSRSARKKDVASARKDELRRERQASGGAAMPKENDPTSATIIQLPAIRTTEASTEQPPAAGTKSLQQKYEDILNGI